MSPHILVIPSFYPTKEDLLSGIFFMEQAQMWQASGVHLGIIYPEIRPLKQISLPLLLKNYFQFSSSMEGKLPTLRRHGWNLFPSFVKGTMKQWKYQAIQLFEKYVSAYGKPDAIHAQSALWAGVAAQAIAEKYSISYFITEHRDNFLQETLLPGNGWLDGAIVPIFDHAEQVIAVSYALKKGIAKYMRYPKREAIVIPNFIDTDFFAPSAQETIQNPFTFLTIAHLFKNKNIDILLHAFHALLKEETNIRLKIGGDGSERAFLEKQVKALGMGSRVEFLGKLDRHEVKTALSSSQAFVLPSRYETFGIVLIEALSMGLPVIGTYSGGPEDIITPDVGTLVPPGDPAALKEAMAVLKLNYQKYSASCLRDYAIARFSKQSVVRKLVDIHSRTI